MTKESAYVPGICNINKAEIAYRRKAMYISLIATILSLALLLVAQIDIYLRSLILFLPLFVTAISYLQVRNRFCVGYASSGEHNADDGHKGGIKIADKKSLSVDKNKARKMNLQAAGIALVIAVAILLIPRF